MIHLFLECLQATILWLVYVEMHFKIKTDRSEILNFLLLQRWQDQVIEFKSFALDIEFIFSFLLRLKYRRENF